MIKKIIIGIIVIGLFLFLIWRFPLMGVSLANEIPLSCTTATTRGDVASYDTGLHQIAGGDLLEGKDDVYKLANSYLQCFCPPEGIGIQTLWIESENGRENGLEWGLEDHLYNYENTEYVCHPTLTPTVTPTAVISDTPTPTVTPTTVQNDPTPTTSWQEEKKQVFPSEAPIFGPQK